MTNLEIMKALVSFRKSDGFSLTDEQYESLIDHMTFPPSKVVVEVSGGVAEVTQCPDGINVEIIDHDNLEAENDAA